MTHEERANEWFANIPNGKDIDLQTRMAICDRIGKKLLGVFFGIVAIEIFYTLSYRRSRIARIYC